MPVAAAAAAIGSSVIGAGASIYGANKAAGAASDAADKNNALQKWIYEQNTANLSPYMNRGNAAGDELNGLFGLGGDQAAAEKAFDTFRNSTNYNWQLNQGLSGVNQGAAARGALNSGATLKALNNYAQNQASGALQGYIGNLQTQQGVGLQGASALAGVGQGYANAVGANNNSAASATGNAALAGAGQINSLISNALNAYGTYQGLSSYGSGGDGGNSGALSSGLGYLQGITRPDYSLSAF